MRILEICFNLAQGGAERFVVDLCNELAHEDDVILMTLMDDKKCPEVRNFYRKELNDSVKYINLGLPNGFHVTSPINILKSVYKEKPDIVHLHSSTIPRFCLLAILFLSWKCKFVQTIHGDIYAGYNSLLYHFLFGILGRMGLYHAVSLSTKNFEDLKKVYPHFNAVHIDNGRAPIKPTQKYSDVTHEIQMLKHDDNTKVFIHVARCADVKDQNLLIRSFNELVKVNNIILLIIGANYESELGANLKKIASSSVYFLGTRNNVSDYLLNADIFCLSSKTEGMPISLIEAQLAGLPMVSTPVCGAVDIIQNGFNGCLSEDHSIEQYTDALQKCNDNLSSFIKNSRTLMTNSQFTIQVCARKYLEFFNHITT